MQVGKKRCEWPGADDLMIAYHDEEWGVPVQDDKKWFEFIVLDTFQAGLSWKIVLHKREGFRNAFANFEVEKVARFTEAQTEIREALAKEQRKGLAEKAVAKLRKKSRVWTVFDGDLSAEQLASGGKSTRR